MVDEILFITWYVSGCTINCIGVNADGYKECIANVASKIVTMDQRDGNCYECNA